METAVEKSEGLPRRAPRRARHAGRAGARGRREPVPPAAPLQADVRHLPRDYQDAQRLEAVKSSLKNGSRVTEALFDAGYGSTSRFYEKAASSLGMAARRYRANGRGETIRYTVFTAADRPESWSRPRRAGICAVKAGRRRGDAAAADRRGVQRGRADRGFFGAARDQAKHWPRSCRGKAISRACRSISAGTVFQRRVWQALSRIPRGETRTYGEIARAIGNPAAVRAVGSACGANPVRWSSPATRGAYDGGLGGYAWASRGRKRLLELEKPTKK